MPAIHPFRLTKAYFLASKLWKTLVTSELHAMKLNTSETENNLIIAKETYATRDIWRIRNLPLIKENDGLIWGTSASGAGRGLSFVVKPTFIFKLNTWIVPLSLDTAKYCKLFEKAKLYISALSAPLLTCNRTKQTKIKCYIPSSQKVKDMWETSFIISLHWLRVSRL